MKLISVAGTSSNAGKTTICELLIRCLSNNNTDNCKSVNGQVSALKITTRHKGVCSRGSCGVCESIKYPYVIKVDSAAIDQEGKDTSRLKEAGAKKVIWLLSFPETLKEGVNSALSYFNDNDIVVIEGNSFLSVHEADIKLLVTRPLHTELKESAGLILDKVDITIINKEEDTSSLQIGNVHGWLTDIGIKTPFIEINPYLDGPMLLKGELFNKLGSI